MNNINTHRVLSALYVILAIVSLYFEVRDAFWACLVMGQVWSAAGYLKAGR